MPSKMIRLFAFVFVLTIGIFVSSQASGLPIIKINTVNEAAINSKEIYTDVSFFSLSDPNNPANDISRIDARDQIRGRGNSTWDAPKRPYRIKFRTAMSLFGLPAARNWVLLASYYDVTFLKDAFAFELGSRLGLPYTHSYQHVQLYLNGIYKGIYILTEHNEVGEGRVEIDKNEGWLVELSERMDDDPEFRTMYYNLPFVIKSPEFEPARITNPAYSFVKNDLNELCNLMGSNDFPENGYRDLIDMETIAKYLLVPVLAANHQDFFGGPLSVFFYKDKGGKISGGPLWDFDNSFGTLWGPYHRTEVTGRFYSPYPGNSFFRRLFQDPVFRAMYKEIWKNNSHSISSMSQFIDSMADKIRKGVEENYNIWWRGLDFDYWIEDMKDFVNTRIGYLDSAYNSVDILPTIGYFGERIPDYYEISPQIFTLVSHGKMNDLTAGLQKGDLSDFEISTELVQQTIGTGGYFGASIKIKPKNFLPIDIHNDTLVLSGENQGKNFYFKVPLTFIVAEKTSIRLPQTATGSIRVYAAGNNIILENFPQNAKIQIYNLNGKQVYSANHANPQILKIPVQTKGVYLVKIGNLSFTLPNFN
jgi:spore coat protein CotH